MSVSFALYGIPVSDGIVIGSAHIISCAIRDVQHYVVPPEEVENEIQRFRSALSRVNHELNQLKDDLTKDVLQDIKTFIEVHQMILQDEMLYSMTIEFIQKRRYNAEWAVKEALDKLTAHFDEIEDEYLRERKADIEQVVERILKVLVDQSLQLAQMVAEEKEKIIMVAHDISPEDMLQLKKKSLGGFVTDVGGRTSHTAIVARGLGIPATVGMQNASLLIHEKDKLIIDGNQGVVIVDPSESVLKEYYAKQTEQRRVYQQLWQLKNYPTQTQCGVPINLYANIELAEDAHAAFSLGANGIGLFRSEFILLDELGLPIEEEAQFVVYRKTVQAMNGLPVTIRTADIGADKFLDVLYDESVEVPKNPSLGLKGIRWSLSEPKLFLEQVRAILRASVFGKVNILIPMLTSADEIHQTFELINEAKAQLDVAGLAYDPDVKIGAMIEVPAAALALPLFLKYFDFLSIGTNDLIQYALAIDRTDRDVSHLYDPLHPAVLYLLNKVISQAIQAGVPISLCGEIAGNTLYTKLLLGMGLRDFSMSSGQLLAVKKEILSTSLSKISHLVKEILSTYDTKKIRNKVEALTHLNKK